ncbi:hypothetical protein GCM10011521_20440 [Arenimonas soli]|uniref:DUF4377 domain-containing protein n=1 Tax=Arenimonas soli TaxID=2269504 RepID=A0ABQ1HMM2_9GAMM|nr:META and DUF4377 domain-containing protein [Arenimonas soli]GGA81987.1 hypothetical protein GCM10011521_20440 [Arenimonas soli]
MRPFRLPALAVAICLTLTACMAPTSREVRPVDDEPLLDKDWRLLSAPDGRNLPTQGAGSAVLRFSGARFSMTGPCNNHGGSWSRNGDQVTLGGEGGIASTKRGCPGELMKRESELLAAFAQPLRAQFTGTQLHLVSADGTRWTFDSQDAPTGAGRERIVLVSGERKPCSGAGAMQCLQVRTEPGAPWQHYYGDIEGFSWQEGVDYVLRIREHTVANPPADGSSRRWVLEEVLDRSR